jgi:hypothetical protein
MRPARSRRRALIFAFVIFTLNIFMWTSVLMSAMNVMSDPTPALVSDVPNSSSDRPAPQVLTDIPIAQTVVKSDRAKICEGLKANGKPCIRITLYEFLIDGEFKRRCCRHSPIAPESTYTLKTPSKTCEHVFLKGRRCNEPARKDFEIDGVLTRRCAIHNPVTLAKQRERVGEKYRKKRAPAHSAREKLRADIAAERQNDEKTSSEPTVDPSVN